MEESHASVLSLVSRTTPPATGGAIDMTVGLLDESLHLHGRLDKITAQLVSPNIPPTLAVIKHPRPLYKEAFAACETAR